MQYEQTDVTYGLLEQRWLATASHDAALSGRMCVQQYSPHPWDCVPEAAPHVDAPFCGRGEVFEQEAALLKVVFQSSKFLSCGLPPCVTIPA